MAGARTRRERLRGWVVVYLKGIAMGAADTVPGVSGGTIALIVGIYERLIRAVTALDPAVLRRVRRLHDPEGRDSLRRDLRGMDVPFLVVLAAGILTAVVSLSRVVHAALAGYRGLTFAFFFGLIGASAVVLADRRWLATPGRVGVAVAGFLVAFALAGATGSGLLPNTLPVVFGAGAVGISAMVLPGISGAFILLLLGQYGYLTGTLTRFVDGMLAALFGGEPEGLAADAVVVATFVAGAAVGILTVAHAVRYALDRYREATFAVLVSLMVGALRLPVIEVTESTGAWTVSRGLTVVGAATLGAAVVLALDASTDDLGY